MAMSFPDSIRPLRRAEYDQLVDLGAFVDERIELLEGLLVPMSPIGTIHCSAVQKLTALLVPPLIGRAAVRVQLAFAALDTSEPEPDVALVPVGDYDTAHPSDAYLLIEVAESSLRVDRDIKQRIYASAHVPEYWIVYTSEKRIEVYTLPGADGYDSVRHITHEGSVAPGAFPDVFIHVNQIVR
jgi:Uma2 family endonuclease